MGRPTKEWSVIDRGSGFWYYKLRGWTSYKSTGIEVRYNLRNKPTNRHEAEVYVSEQAALRTFEREDGPTLREFLEPFFTVACPHCERLANDDQPFLVKEKRYCCACKDRYVEVNACVAYDAVVPPVDYSYVPPKSALSPRGERRQYVSQFVDWNGEIVQRSIEPQDKANDEQSVRVELISNLRRSRN